MEDPELSEKGKEEEEEEEDKEDERRTAWRKSARIQRIYCL